MSGCTFNKKANIQNLMRALFLNSMGGNTDASGIAFVTDDDIAVVKKDVRGTDLINTKEYDDAEDEYVGQTTRFLMGHCRFKTKGHQRNNKNNHPIVRDLVVGVHNGCLSNDDELFRKYSNHFARNAEVDSEIIFALVEHFSKISDHNRVHEAIVRMAAEVKGSMACSLVHRYKPTVLWLFRNGYNGCDILHFKDAGLIVWATAERYINVSTKEFESVLGPATKIQIGPMEGISIDLHRNKIFNFDLK